MNTEDGIDNWSEDDFKVPQIKTPLVEDPWQVDRPHIASKTDKSQLSPELTSSKSSIYIPSVDKIEPFNPSGSQQTHKNQSGPGTNSESSSGLPSAFPNRSVLNARHPGHQTPKPKSISQEEVNLHIDSSVENDEVPEFDEIDLLGFDDWSDNYVPNKQSIQDEFIDYEEPEPIREYNPYLHENLHKRSQSSHDLRGNLQIDEWLSKIDYLDEDEVREITETLLDFSVQRRNSWLRWLYQKQWSGDILIQFFRDWSDIESYREFYKTLRWSESQKRYYEIESSNGWTFVDRLWLTERSMEASSGQVVDYEWLYDWQNADPWLRVRNGFFTFASFAMYRSLLNDYENWKRYPDFDVDFETPLNNYSGKRVLSEFASGLTPPYTQFSIASWFAYQDWYNQTEWHDDHGW